MVTKDFKNAAPPVREPKAKLPPSSEKVHKAGIQTKATIDWQARQPPPVLRPEPSPEDPGGWRTAVKTADSEHAARIQNMRERFQAKGEKMRQDFRTAHNYRGRER